MGTKGKMERIYSYFKTILSNHITGGGISIAILRLSNMDAQKRVNIAIFE